MKTLFSLLAFAAVFSSCNNDARQTANNAEKENLNKAFIEQYFTHFNNHDWKKMADMYIEQPEMKDPAFGLKSIKMTKTDIVKKYQELHEMINDVHDEVKNIYHAGDNVIVEFESSGTAPDSRKFVLPICTVFEIKDSKITKDFTYYDNFEEPNK
jgi:ketosteroid isomerase-like protein